MIVTIVVVFLVGASVTRLLLLTIAVLALVGYWAFAMPTDCRVQTRFTPRCGHSAKGHLRGCRCHPEHGRVKARAVFGAVRLPYPIDFLHGTWLHRSASPAAAPTTTNGGIKAVAATPVYTPTQLEVVALAVSVIGALAGVGQVALIVVRY